MGQESNTARFLNQLLPDSSIYLHDPRLWRRLRRFVGWNQAEFGRRINVSGQLISRWETGDSSPTRQHTIEAQKALSKEIRRVIEEELNLTCSDYE